MMLQLGYIGLSLATVLILYFIGNYSILKSVDDIQQQKKKRMILITGLLLWQIYLFLLGQSGILVDFSFPPRFVLLMILPAFIFIGTFLRRNKKAKWIQVIPPSWLVGYQAFRIIIETLFVYSVVAGLLHQNVTIEGYNFDMVFAFTAIIMLFVLYRSKTLPKRLLLAWNYAGLLVIASIIFLFLTTIYTPEIYGPDTAPFPTDFGWYPYVLVPGFLMPSAVFVHVLSIVQLNHRAKG